MAYHFAMLNDAPRPPRGRPRDPNIDSRVREATLELLVEEGFEATTVQAIAERSGVHASAIYRRWGSRADIIEEVVFPGLPFEGVEPSGDLRRDLRRLIRPFVSVMVAPAARAAVPGLLASYQSSGRSGAPETWLGVSARPRFLAILEHAPAGSVDPAVDPMDVFDMLVGAILARSLVPTVAARNRPVERLVDMILRLLRPDPPDAPPDSESA
jgi:AcrR family transcriptional regulator